MDTEPALPALQPEEDHTRVWIERCAAIESRNRRYSRVLWFVCGLALGAVLGLAAPRIRVHRLQDHASECPPCPKGQTCSKGTCLDVAVSEPSVCSESRPLSAFVVEVQP